MNPCVSVARQLCINDHSGQQRPDWENERERERGVVGRRGRNIDGDTPAQRERWLPQQRSRLNVAQPCARLQPAEPTFPLATGAGEEEENGLVAQCGGAAHARNSDQRDQTIKQKRPIESRWAVVQPVKQPSGLANLTTHARVRASAPCNKCRDNNSCQYRGWMASNAVQRISWCAFAVVSSSGQSSAPGSIPAPVASHEHYTRPGRCVKLGGTWLAEQGSRCTCALSSLLLQFDQPCERNLSCDVTDFYSCRL